MLNTGSNTRNLALLLKQPTKKSMGFPRVTRAIRSKCSSTCQPLQPIVCACQKTSLPVRPSSKRGFSIPTFPHLPPVLIYDPPRLHSESAADLRHWHLGRVRGQTLQRRLQRLDLPLLPDRSLGQRLTKIWPWACLKIRPIFGAVMGKNRQTPVKNDNW